MTVKGTMNQKMEALKKEGVIKSGLEMDVAVMAGEREKGG